MAFRGIYLAQKLTPTECGLFSVARITTHNEKDENQTWVRGFSYEFDTRPTVNLLENAGAVSHTIYDGTGQARFEEYVPFFFEVEDFRSTFSLTGEDRFDRVMRQIEAGTQKAVETELWNGYTARTDGTPNCYLSKPGSATILGSSTASKPLQAISLLEDAIGNSPTGEKGVIHMTRGTALVLAGNFIVSEAEPKDVKDMVETVNSTPVVVGSGYQGDGPVFIVSNKALASNVATITTTSAHFLTTGETVEVTGVDAVFNGTYTVASTPTPTSFTYAKTHADVTSASSSGYAQMKGSSSTKWVYATGHVEVILGKSEVVNESLAQGYDVGTNQNNMRIKAQRPAAAYFDPSIHYAVKIDLTA